MCDEALTETLRGMWVSFLGSIGGDLGTEEKKKQNGKRWRSRYEYGAIQRGTAGKGGIQDL